MTHKSVVAYFLISAACILLAASVGFAQNFLAGLDLPKQVRTLRVELEQSRADTQAAKEDLQHALEKIDRVLKVMDSALDVVKQVEATTGK